MKGWELLKEIAKGNIKEGTRIKTDILEGNYYYNGKSFRSEIDNYYLNEVLTDEGYANSDFTIIEEQEEINIQDIKTLNKMAEEQLVTNTDVMDKLDEVIQALKQLDNEIKLKAQKGSYNIVTGYNVDGDIVNRVVIK